MKTIAAIVFAAILASGCATEKMKEAPMPTNKQLRLVGTKMVEKMITDEDFLDTYSKIKRKRGKPTISFAYLEISAAIKDLGYSDKVLIPVRDALRVELRKTGMFSVKEVQNSEELDYSLSGDLYMSEDRAHYYLMLRLICPSEDNREIWNELMDVLE